MSQVDSSEHTLDHLSEHFHEVKEARLSHWASLVPQLFYINRQWH